MSSHAPKGSESKSKTEFPSLTLYHESLRLRSKRKRETILYVCLTLVSVIVICGLL